MSINIMFSIYAEAEICRTKEDERKKNYITKKYIIHCVYVFLVDKRDSKVKRKLHCRQ